MENVTTTTRTTTTTTTTTTTFKLIDRDARVDYEKMDFPPTHRMF